MAVQGYVFDSENNNTGVIADVNLSNLTTPPSATGLVSVSANIDADAEIVNPIAGGTAFDAANAAETSNFSTSITIYDSLGNDHVVTVYFEKSDDTAMADYAADRSWKWHAVVDGGDLVGGTEGVGTEILSGTLTFNENGSLRTFTQDTTDVDFAGGAELAQTITLNFGTPTETDGSGGAGLDGTTQFAGPQVINYQQQDGFSQGQLQSIDIDASGLIQGFFSNGSTRAVAQLALANFQNPEGLFKVGGNLYSQTTFSGLPTYGEPGTGSFGTIASSTLELSNVDLTNEFVQMITNQRGFQANSRVITVGDELLQDVVNLT
jgi:flagellar hook protein FlgE